MFQIIPSEEEDTVYKEKVCVYSISNKKRPDKRKKEQCPTVCVRVSVSIRFHRCPLPLEGLDVLLTRHTLLLILLL